MYAKNISTVLLHLIDNGTLPLDLDDEITGWCVFRKKASYRPGAEACLIGDAVDFSFGRKKNRDVWGLDDLGEDFRSPIVSDSPTLFCSGTFDGNIGSNVAEIIAGFSNGVHVVFENAGHEDYMSHDATAPMVAGFLKGKTDFPRHITLPVPRFVAVTE